jgi:hypothetical protein
VKKTFYEHLIHFLERIVGIFEMEGKLSGRADRKNRGGEVEEDLEFVEAKMKWEILVTKLDFLGIFKTKR